MDVRSSGQVGHGLGVLFDLLRLPGDERGEILDQQARTGCELSHGIRLSQGQMALEKDPVEAGNRPGDVEVGNRAGDAVLVLIDKALHGVLLSTSV